jgi:hypothetical protein
LWGPLVESPLGYKPVQTLKKANYPPLVVPSVLKPTNLIRAPFPVVTPSVSLMRGKLTWRKSAGYTVIVGRGFVMEEASPKPSEALPVPHLYTNYPPEPYLHTIGALSLCVA